MPKTMLLCNDLNITPPYCAKNHRPSSGFSSSGPSVPGVVVEPTAARFACHQCPQTAPVRAARLQLVEPEKSFYVNDGPVQNGSRVVSCNIMFRLCECLKANCSSSKVVPVLAAMDLMCKVCAELTWYLRHFSRIGHSNMEHTEWRRPMLVFPSYSVLSVSFWIPIFRAKCCKGNTCSNLSNMDLRNLTPKFRAEWVFHTLQMCSFPQETKDRFFRGWPPDVAWDLAARLPPLGRLFLVTSCASLLSLQWPARIQKAGFNHVGMNFNHIASIQSIWVYQYHLHMDFDSQLSLLVQGNWIFWNAGDPTMGGRCRSAYYSFVKIPGLGFSLWQPFLKAILMISPTTTCKYVSYFMWTQLTIVLNAIN